MATAVQLRRGTTAQMVGFSGLEGELSMDSTLGKLYVGHEGSKKEQVNTDSPQNLSSKTLDNTNAVNLTHAGTVFPHNLVTITYVQVLSSGTSAAGAFISIAAAVPPNAKTVLGFFFQTNAADAGGYHVGSTTQGNSYLGNAPYNLRQGIPISFEIELTTPQQIYYSTTGGNPVSIFISGYRTY